MPLEVADSVSNDQDWPTSSGPRRSTPVAQRIAPERGVHTSEPDKTFERAVCTVCNWTGSPLQVTVRHRDPSPPEGDCVIMEVPLRGPKPPKPRSH